MSIYSLDEKAPMCVGLDMEKKQTKIKARRMWANYYLNNTAPWLHDRKKWAIEASGGATTHQAIPVAVIPLDDVEALIQKAAEAYWQTPQTHTESVRAALTAIGVLPKQRKGRK